MERKFPSFPLMKLRGVFVFVLTVAVVSAICELGQSRLGGAGGDNYKKTNLGGIHDYKGSQNSVEIESLARFAVQEYNKKENALLQFRKVLKAKEQVVAGKVYYLTLEAIDSGQMKIYEAKVWVKPWVNFKELQEFKNAQDLVDNQGHPGPGWRVVSTHDPEVHDAAIYAVKTIQQRSNSLFPYELIEILIARIKAIGTSCRYDMLLKVKRGTKEEKFRVEISKDAEGGFYLDRMEEDGV